ncbi:UNVERIFIED_CONTAM: hypothetical protein Sindi_1718000 [Sesamum indicum]
MDEELGCHSSWTWASQFNMEEFLQLAHKVLDTSDEASKATLERLKFQWESKFGRWKKMIALSAMGMISFSRGLCKACRHLISPANKEAAADIEKTRVVGEMGLSLPFGKSLAVEKEMGHEQPATTAVWPATDSADFSDAASQLL